MISAHTSGTTGAGLKFLIAPEAHREQYAVWWRYFRAHGLEPGTLCAYFGGRSVVPITQKGPPFWRTNRPGNQEMFSAYHATPENIEYYLRHLNRLQAPWLHGYPSQLSWIAGHALETGFKLTYQPRWITLGAENLLEQQKETIAKAFGIAPLEHYGMAEGVANISQSPEGRMHVDEDYAAVEFLPIAGTDVYKIIGTGFTNRATPLIRYDVGDTARLPQTAPGPSGWPGRIVESVDGRQEDYVELPDGARVGRLDHIFKDLITVREAQIVQYDREGIEIRMVPTPMHRREDEDMLIRECRSRLGDEIKIEIRHVDQIEKTRTGKLRFVISKLRENQLPG